MAARVSFTVQRIDDGDEAADKAEDEKETNSRLSREGDC